MAEITTRDQADAAVAELMGESAPAQPQAEQQEQPAESPQSGDQLVNELRGTVDGSNEAPASEGSEESSATQPEPLDTPHDILAKLQKANKDAGKAGYQLGQARQELSEKDAHIAALEQRIASLESGSSSPPTNSEQPSVSLSDAQLDDFMQNFDKNWAESREDPYKKDAARYAAEMTLALYKQVQNQISEVSGGVLDMHFNTRLERLGISRDRFDALWKDPAYAWGEALTPEQRLAALETQAGTMGTLPSKAGSTAASPSVPGARSTSRVSPRTIETSQSGGSATPNPLRLSELDVAVQEKDRKKLNQLAGPLWDRFMQGV